ncbi:MAG TPA: 5-bromo-4-chloroindolyl phosphate hydrolysis family protein [Clostridia bacterium]|nr:5-bromo-4-chloroindolyl phosphate hydrolysis family protein [Clostridia bacterium]
MGCRRGEHRPGNFGDMNMNCNNRHGGCNSLVGLIFSIISFSITLAFKIVGVVFQALFGLLSGIIGSGSRVAQAAKDDSERVWNDKQTASYTVSGSKQESAGKKPEGKGGSDAKSKVREFKKPDSGRAQAEKAKAEDMHDNEVVQNKDFYVVLFVLTIIPATVALAMGKLLYAGAIGAVGFGLMLIAGIVSGIAASMKKNAAEKKAEVVEEEPEEKDSVEKLIKDAFEKLFEIRKDVDKIKDADIREKIEAVCCTGEKIIGEVRTNPEGLTHVRKFFYYYLDAFAEIVKKYLRLSSFEESSEEVGKLVAETERSFADIDAIFRELCEKLLEKDMLNLKAEINVIRNSN